MPYNFPAQLSRFVTFEDDPDCRDTYAVSTIVRADVDRDGIPEFLEAEVIEDARDDDGRIRNPRGEIIGANGFTEKNMEEMESAFLRSRQWDAPDNVQHFPPDDVQRHPVEDYNQLAA